jgi:hypothetical protein
LLAQIPAFRIVLGVRQHVVVSLDRGFGGSGSVAGPQMPLGPQ